MTLKSFTDIDLYQAQIEALVPGYQTLHETLPLVAASLRPSPQRVLVVGCGPGPELIHLAEALPEAQIDALDQEHHMLEAARGACAHLPQISLYHCPLEHLKTEPYDLVIATLVGHLIPDDGSRQAFLHHIARQMHTDSRAILTDLVHSGPWHDEMTRATILRAKRRGLPPEKLQQLGERLRGGFALLSEQRYGELLQRTGLTAEGSFFRSLGVVGLILSKTETLSMARLEVLPG